MRWNASVLWRRTDGRAAAIRVRQRPAAPKGTQYGCRDHPTSHDRAGNVVAGSQHHPSDAVSFHKRDLPSGRGFRQTWNEPTTLASRIKALGITH